MSKTTPGYLHITHTLKAWPRKHTASLTRKHTQDGTQSTYVQTAWPKTHTHIYTMLLKIHTSQHYLRYCCSVSVCVDPLKTNNNIVLLYFTEGFYRTSISPSITFQQLNRQPYHHGNNIYIMSWHILFILSMNATVCSVVIFVCQLEVSQFHFLFIL